MEYTALTDVFGEKLTYSIPPYQRPYSWDCIGKSEKNNQINIMWDDIYNFFQDKHKGLYFMGSMVLIPNKLEERLFEVIDGQQRLTSITLLIVAMKCFLKKIKSKTIYYDIKLDEFIDEIIRDVEKVVFNKEFKGVIEIKKKVKIEKSAEFDYDVVLENVLECSEKPQNKELKTKYKFVTEEQKKIILRYYKNRIYFEDRIEENFLTNNKFTENDFIKLNNFLDFLKTKISFVIIKAKNFEFAYRIFETLNNRGLPLSNKDLFRNFMIEQFDAIKIEKPDTDPIKKWNDLDTNFELKEDFIGRWVESKKGGQQKLSAFNDLKEIIYNSDNFYKDDKLNKIKKIEFLYNDFKKDLSYYTLINKPELIDNIEIRNRVLFLENCGNNRYTTNLLISLFRHLKYESDENSNLNDFLKIYEQFVLHTLLHSGKRFSSSPIYKAINLLNKNRFNEAKKEISDKTNINELKSLIDDKITDNSTAKLLISKYIWHLQLINKDDVISQILYYNKATLEHIIPQKPEINSNWENEFSVNFRNKYIYKLGNMTLLSLALNASANNHDFSKKKMYYEKTNLAFTKDIIKDEISEKDIETRHENIIEGIYTDLGINS